MPDELDYSSEQYDGWLANRIENIRRASVERKRIPVGRCYNCDASIPEGVTFCDADCQHDEEKRERYAKINGGRTEVRGGASEDAD